MSESTCSYFVEVENQIQLTDVSEVLVQYFYKGLHEFQYNELIVVLIHDGDEIEAGISFIYDFVLFVVQEVAHLGVSGDDQLVDLPNEEVTSLRIRCFSDWDRLEEYHFVNLDLPWRLIRKKQWIIIQMFCSLIFINMCQIYNYFYVERPTQAKGRKQLQTAVSHPSE